MSHDRKVCHMTCHVIIHTPYWHNDIWLPVSSYHRAKRK